MAKHFLVLASVLSLMIVSLVSAEGKGESKKSFLSSFYEALTYEKVFDKLFDVSFKPKDVVPEYYHNIRLFMTQAGDRHPGSLPARTAAAVKKAFKNVTPKKYFEAFSNSKESTFKKAGVLKKHHEEELAKEFASTLKKALKHVGGSGPKAGLRALATGSADFFNILGITKPYQIKRHMEGFIKEISKE